MENPELSKFWVNKEPDRSLSTRDVKIQCRPSQCEGIKRGDIIAISNRENAKECGAFVASRTEGEGRISMDKTLLRDLNLGEGLNEEVEIKRIDPPEAETVELEIPDDMNDPVVVGDIRKFIIKKPFSEGNEFVYPYSGKFLGTIKIVKVTPKGIVKISRSTKLKPSKKSLGTLKDVKEIIETDYGKTDGIVVKSPDDLEISFDDIGGSDKIKEIFKTIKKVIDDPESAKEYNIRSGNVLLYGPPGTGKTMLGKAAAKECGMNFIEMGQEIFDKYVGQSQQNVRRYFEAVKKNVPCILFIDEVDGILSRRSDEYDSTSKKVVNQFLKGWDDIMKQPKVFVIAATNNRQLLDQAAWDRFGEHIEVPLPDYATRKKIFEISLGIKREKVLENGIDYDLLATLTEGFSGRDIEKSVCEKAALYAFNEDRSITMEDLTKEIQNTIDSKQIKKRGKPVPPPPEMFV